MALPAMVEAMEVMVDQAVETAQLQILCQMQNAVELYPTAGRQAKPILIVPISAFAVLTAALIPVSMDPNVRNSFLDSCIRSN